MSEQLYLLACVAGRQVAVAAEQVEGVVDVGAVVPVPHASAVVRGLMALRSRIVTVIDTPAALGLPLSERPTPRAIVTSANGHAYAMLVDALDDVAPLTASPLPGALGGSGGWATVGRGVVERDGEPVLVIDLTALIPEGA